MPSETSLAIIAVCQLIITVALVAAAVGIVVVMLSFKRMINKKMDEMMDRVEPIVKDAKSIAEQARETAEKVSEKVDSIMTKADDTADKVAGRLDSVTSAIAAAVSPQAPAIAGFATAALKVYQVFQQFTSARQADKSAEKKE